MENFTFHNPTKLIFGKNTIRLIGRELANNEISKALLLAGGGSIKLNGVYDAVVNSLRKYNIEWDEHWGVRVNPVLSHSLEGVKIAKENNSEAILAVGGGSVLDEGKSIAAGIFLPDLWHAFENKIEIEQALPVFTILTLSGTGSEMDPFAVLTNEENKKKWNISGKALYPKVSIVDPSVQMSLPWKQTVNGAIDAMSHIMEYYFPGESEEITISMNEAMMRTIIKCVDNLKINPRDYNWRANLAWTTTLALNGISGIALHGGDWAVHTIEHGVSALFPDVAHGTGLAVIFPAWIEYMNHYNLHQFNRWAVNVWNAANIKDGITKMKMKYMDWGAPTTLKELGIAESDIPKITDNIMLRHSIGVLKELDRKDILTILELAY